QASRRPWQGYRALCRLPRLEVPLLAAQLLEGRPQRRSRARRQARPPRRARRPWVGRSQDRWLKAGMSLTLAGQLFTGPFPIETTEIRANQAPVVYAVIAKGGPSWAPVFRVVDVGSSPEEGVRFAVHPNRAAWAAEPGESLGLYFFYARRSD